MPSSVMYLLKLNCRVMLRPLSVNRTNEKIQLLFLRGNMCCRQLFIAVIFCLLMFNFCFADSFEDINKLTFLCFWLCRF